jgi:signal recognition particle GTPase
MPGLAALRAAASAVETLFVVDSRRGQDAVERARTFNETRCRSAGVVLTKLDGDARRARRCRCAK